MPLLARRNSCRSRLLLVAGLFLVALSGGERLHAQANMQANGSTGAQIVIAGSPGRIEQGARTWSIFTEYSPDSSRIFLGNGQNREFVTLGASFTQRIFQHRIWSLDYRAEIRPLMVESDPVQTGLDYSIYLPPRPGSVAVHQVGHDQYPHEIPELVHGPQSISRPFVYLGQTYFQDYRFYYGRRWTYVGGLSPAGLQARLLPHARTQPVFTLMTGFSVSPRDIPIFNSSSFNFTFSLGAGFDVFRTQAHAVRLEYRYHHLSNAFIGTNNPGLDSQMIHVGYSWGK